MLRCEGRIRVAFLVKIGKNDDDKKIENIVTKSSKRNNLPTKQTMPEPKVKFSIQEINSQFYGLSTIDSVTSEGYIYRLDINTHRLDVQNAREYLDTAKHDFENGIITSEEYELANNEYLHEVYKYNLIDEDDRICGEYFTNTKTYEIFNKRIIIHGTVCYCDKNMYVTTYSGSLLGTLHVGENMEMEIIGSDDNTMSENGDSEEEYGGHDEMNSDYVYELAWTQR